MPYSESVPVPANTNFQLTLTAMELSVISLAVSTTQTHLTEDTQAVATYLAYALLQMLAAGNTPRDIVDALNSVSAKLDIIADHYTENPHG